MRHIATLVGLCICGFSLAASDEVRHLELHDATRDRVVPVRLWTPDGPPPEQGRPMVLFSHGLGGSREAADYLGTSLTRAGYVFVNLQHPGSDESVWRGLAPRDVLPAMKEAVNAENAQDRAADVSFVVDTLLADRDLAVDPQRIGMAGHSFGANTTMIVVGQQTARGTALMDPRIKAAIPMSPRPAEGRRAYLAVAVPMLHLTGTRDTSPVDPSVKPEDRRHAFDHLDAARAGDQFLIVFDGAEHGAFSGSMRGRRMSGDRQVVEHVHAVVARAAVRFFDAYLNGRTLELDALRALVGPSDVVEKR